MDYEIKLPEGQKFKISGPEGFTQEQAWSALQQQIAQVPGQDPELLGFNLHPEEGGAAGGIYKRAGAELLPSAKRDVMETGEALWSIISNPKAAWSALKEQAQSEEGIGGAIWNDITRHYGSVDRAQKTFETDPTRFLLDVVTLPAGGAALLRKIGTITAGVGRHAIPEIAAAAARETGATVVPPTAEAFRAAGEAGVVGRPAIAEFRRGIAQAPTPAGAARVPSTLYEGAGEALGTAGWRPRHLTAPSVLGAATGMLTGGVIPGSAAGAAGMAASSPRLMGETMLNLGRMQRYAEKLPRMRTGGLAGGTEMIRDQIQKQAKELLKDKEQKKQLEPEQLKTLRQVRSGKADSRTMLLARRILEGRTPQMRIETGFADLPDYGGPDAGAPSRQEGGKVTQGVAYDVGDAPGATPETPKPETFVPDRPTGADEFGQRMYHREQAPKPTMQHVWDTLLAGGRGLEDLSRRLKEAGNAAFFAPEEYDPRAPLEAATMMMGGGIPAAERGAVGVAGGRLEHGLSKIKLPKPVEEMEATYKGTPPAERIIKPSDLSQGSALLPMIGDRSIAGRQLTGVGGQRLRSPVELQGGHGYMPAQAGRGAIWAAGESITPRLENVISKLTQTTGRDVYLPYTAMGERAVDFSHHVSDTLSELIKKTDLSKRAATTFDRMMKAKSQWGEGVADWPGVGAKNLKQYLIDAPGSVRNKFAKTMDTREMQDLGFPSVAEARFAVTDPRLLHEPTGASGLSIGKATPGAARPTTEHRTYPAGMAGEYVGGFGASVPKEIMYPDIINAFKKMGYRPDQYDYLMARMPKGAPIAQKITQKWIDEVSQWLQSKGMVPSVSAIAALAGMHEATRNR